MTEPITPEAMERAERILRNRTPNLNKALAAFQAEMPKIERDRHVEVETKGDKPNYGYSYATLANVTAVAMPLLGKHGLAFTAFPGTGPDGKMALSYSLLHESGEERSGIFPLSGEGGIQVLGGRFTYARRYCLIAVTGLAADEDDDAAAAQAEDEANASTVQRRRQERQSMAGRPRKPAPASAPDPGPARANRAPAGPPPLPHEIAGPVGEPEDVGPPRNPDAPVSRDQQKHIFALFNDLGYGGDVNREARLGICEKLTGRKVASSNDLTAGEAHTVIENLIRKQEYEARKAAEAKQTKPNKAAPAPARTRREQITGVPDDNAGPAPWEPGDGELATETGGRL